MLQKLPTELLCVVMKHLTYDDLDELNKIRILEPIVRHHLLHHYRFHYQVSSLLRLFESSLINRKKKKKKQFNDNNDSGSDHDDVHEDRREDIANQLLELICHAVEKCPKHEHRSKFSDLLNILEARVVKRILAYDMIPQAENDYALLCLDIRYKYLHSPSIRVLHDPVSSLRWKDWMIGISIKKWEYWTLYICSRNIEDEVQNIL
ncbi:hypothetical protein BDA99DRAFT_290804 [Phascolomyces articulosus]|uniref:F-box domain-containing protein n=1 Tax=Phascolomyces articulosus TaxID=60185 RepID=A0AAD5JLR9_9FUNG|nr:hypothetical protein BDA99DRAFT_290804 [Phascolomyces articulosus]